MATTVRSGRRAAIARSRFGLLGVRAMRAPRPRRRRRRARRPCAPRSGPGAGSGRARRRRRARPARAAIGATGRRRLGSARATVAPAWWSSSAAYAPGIPSETSSTFGPPDPPSGRTTYRGRSVRARVAERVGADVCVVGAGYAGLTAARRLSQQGRTVVVLEARDRVGGRIWTEPLADGTPVDRGGAWLGPGHHGRLRPGPRGRRRRPTRPTSTAPTSSSARAARAATRGSSRRSARWRCSASPGRSGRSTASPGPCRSTSRGPRQRRRRVGLVPGQRVPRAHRRPRSGIARDLYATAVARALRRRPVQRVSFLHLLLLVRGPREHQHAVLDRGRRAGEHDRRRRRLDRRNGWPTSSTTSGSAARSARSPSGATRSSSPRDEVDGRGPPRRGGGAAAARARDRVRPAAPRRSDRALPGLRRRLRDQDAAGLRRAVLAGRRASAARPPRPGSAAEVTLDASPASGRRRA